MEERITLVLVDDHSMVRKGVRAFLETQPDLIVVGEAESGEASVRVCADLAPDVVLMDLILGAGMDGIEATRRVKEVSPRTQVIILTSYYDESHTLPALRAGALSYLLKDVGSDELASAVRAAARGDVVLHPRVAAQMMDFLRGGSGAGSVSRAPAAGGAAEDGSPLTARETEVLRLIADGLSNTDIAERLFLSEKTVKSHVSNILSKLHLTDRTQAAVYAWREGIVTRDA
jgi:Response regulator containing a CheY-like receiver domain and an HTH DNA-binding domain